jgi:hypothetical protein
LSCYDGVAREPTDEAVGRPMVKENEHRRERMTAGLALS